MIKAVLFDLDGTLLPMDQEVFLRAYMHGISKKLAPYGYEPEKLVKCIFGGTMAMIKNDGRATNEQVFWQFFEAAYGKACRSDEPHFEEFYKNEFQDIQKVCGYTPKSREVLDILHAKSVPAVLATSPIFPAIATEIRMRWAGVCPEDFVLYTTYENISFTKPNPEYYREICRCIGLAPEECLMVGNDVGDDMIAQSIGMKVFLLTDCLINKDGADISQYPNGNFDNLIEYIKENV